jgi:hypothetical protein
MRSSWYVPFPNPDIVPDVVEPLEVNRNRVLGLLNARRT